MDQLLHLWRLCTIREETAGPAVADGKRKKLTHKNMIYSWKPQLKRTAAREEQQKMTNSPAAVTAETVE